DCGGATCDGSGHTCADTLHCGVAGDCQSGVCAGTVCQAPSCTDLVENGGETGVDCGGSDGVNACGACVGTMCTVSTDCHSLHCDTAGTGLCTP
ncbi:MAG: hypothetical protein ABI467_23765, partial [Kofleriaceae bacterium]